MDDPYKVLGVAPDASASDIHDAYLKLAKKHHPDLNPGKADAEDRFKAVSAANDLLSDSTQRGKFDRGEIDAGGQERPQRRTYRDFADGTSGQRYSGPTPDGSRWGAHDFTDLFGSMFDEADPSRRMGGQDRLYALDVSFLDAVNGATRRLTMPDGADFDVKIPPGTSEGQVLRLRGKGDPGRNGGGAGDVLIEVHIAAHAHFRRDGQDIRLDLPVSFAEAVLGAQVEVPTPAGPVRLRVPPHSDTGTTLRLRGKGVPAHGSQLAGDLFATLRLVVGQPDAALEAFLKDWKPEHPANPRHTLETTS